MVTDEDKALFDILNTDHLWNVIEKTMSKAWRQSISRNNVEKWLSNFTGECLGDSEIEKKIALWLLTHYSLYTNDDLKTLCKDAFNKYVHIVLCRENDLAVDEILKRTCFIPMGNPSESGAFLLYYFRQTNKLSKNVFETDDSKQDIVLVDDISISGEQAEKYLEDKLHLYPDRNVHFMTIFSTLDSINRIKGLSCNINCIYTTLLDERDKAFSDESGLFQDDRLNRVRPYVEDLCRFYGSIAVSNLGYMEKYPLGFADGQYLFGFEYNVPDNTLPIFWSSNNWQPLFERKPKIYDDEKRQIDDRKYY